MCCSGERKRDWAITSNAFRFPMRSPFDKLLTEGRALRLLKDFTYTYLSYEGVANLLNTRLHLGFSSTYASRLLVQLFLPMTTKQIPILWKALALTQVQLAHQSSLAPMVPVTKSYIFESPFALTAFNDLFREWKKNDWKEGGERLHSKKRGLVLEKR